MRKIVQYLLIGIAIIVIALVSFSFILNSDRIKHDYSRAEVKECGEDGGEYIVTGGFIQKYNCVYFYGDAGELCESSDECEGVCMIYHVDDEPFCSYHSDSRVGSCSGVVEDRDELGEISMLCID